MPNQVTSPTSLCLTDGCISVSSCPHIPVARGFSELVEAETRVAGIYILFTGLITIDPRWVWALGKRRDRNIKIAEEVRKVKVARWARRRSGRLGFGSVGCWGWWGEGTVSIRDNRVRCILFQFGMISIVVEVLIMLGINDKNGMI
jgi:hypothetical protein